MSETVNGVAFAVLAFASIGGAFGMLSARSSIHAVFWLAEVMLAVGGLYLLLSAEFLAVVQILVYGGAVSVLMLFVTMLTMRRGEDSLRPAALSAGGVLFTGLLGTVLYVAIARYGERVSPMPAEAPGTVALSESLLTRWALPFQVAPLVLLVALVAAVWWTWEEER